MDRNIRTVDDVLARSWTACSRRRPTAGRRRGRLVGRLLRGPRQAVPFFVAKPDENLVSIDRRPRRAAPWTWAAARPQCPPPRLPGLRGGRRRPPRRSPGPRSAPGSRGHGPLPLRRRLRPGRCGARRSVRPDLRLRLLPPSAAAPPHQLSGPSRPALAPGGISPSPASRPARWDPSCPTRSSTASPACTAVSPTRRRVAALDLLRPHGGRAAPHARRARSPRPSARRSSGRPCSAAAIRRRGGVRSGPSRSPRGRSLRGR